MTMPNTRELAIFEKWSEAAVTSLPPLSPTSPKATKFCCCPNRRRYNIKQSKKSTLHPKNIFSDNDFKHIDEISTQKPNENSNRNQFNCTKKTTEIVLADISDFPEESLAYEKKISVKFQSSKNKKCTEQKDEHTTHKCEQSLQNNKNDFEIYDENSQRVLSKQTDSTKILQNNPQTHETSLSSSNCKIEKPANPDTGQIAQLCAGASNVVQQREKIDSNNKIVQICNSKSQENIFCNSNNIQQIQRLSNSKLNLNSDNKFTSSCSQFTPAKHCGNFYRSHQKQQKEIIFMELNRDKPKNDLKIELNVAATDVSKIKQIVCGSPTIVELPSEVSVMATTTNDHNKSATKTSTQPSITTTVIKTTMVKRSPSNEKTSNEDTVTPADNEPSLSVKQRIAKITAGNDAVCIVKRSNNTCNKNGIENKIRLQRSPPVSSNYSKTLPFPTSKRDLSSKPDSPVQVRLSPSSNTSVDNALITTTGCATMPRRSYFKLGSNGVNDNNSSDNTNQKLAALDNLDLALNLADENGEDPYIVLQEYLEKVKLEINEVFELHKARQKVQKSQQHQSINSDSTDSTNNLSQSIEVLNTVCDKIDKSDRSKMKLANKFMTHVLNGKPTQEEILQVIENHKKCKSVGPKLASTLRPNQANAKLETSHQREQQQQKEKETQNEDVNIWANKFLRDLDTLIATEKHNTSDSAVSSENAITTFANQSSLGKATLESKDELSSVNGFVPKPVRHTTIPLQSFNLECGRIGNNNCNETKQNIVYMRTLSAPIPYEELQNDNELSCVATGTNNRNSFAAFNTSAFDQYQQQHPAEIGNRQENSQNTGVVTSLPMAALILKIEETAANEAESGDPPMRNTADVHRKQAEVCNEMENLRCVPSNQKELLSFAADTNFSGRSKYLLEGPGSSTVATTTGSALALPKHERIEQANSTLTVPTACLNPSKTLIGAMSTCAFNNSDATKKGSTSTIWTSEESVLRSVGVVDEDNNSSSSSACEEASGVLSSGKSGNSLDSSGLDNDNNESGIGTATPPKDLCYWKNAHNDNGSMSSFEAARKINFPNSSSVTSSDDPDLLEVLSLCDEPNDIIELQSFDESEYGDIQKDATIKAVCADKRTKKSNDQNVTVDNAEKFNNDINIRHNEDVENHDEFYTLQFCDCDCTDGDASSASGSGHSGNHRITSASACQDTNSNVMMRRKNAHLQLPYGSRAQKCRSHSLDTSYLSSSPHNYMQHLHPHSLLVRKLQHCHNRTKERGQLSLALRQEPFQSLLTPAHFNELPSPSSASLHSGHESLGVQELTTKSNSAPLLMKQEKKRDDFGGQKLALRYSRSQSDRYLAEIEAVEACKWLRAAGFPQYAQMYEDHQFPLDLTNVAHDHTNLENDQLQSLYRRLCILNRCATMRLDQSHKTQTPQKEDSDEENFALSENWTFQPHIRRWSRIGEMGLELPSAGQLNEKTESSSKESSPDRFEDDAYDISGAALSLTLPGIGTGDSADSTLNESAEQTAVRLRRTGSERIKDGAKALLRRVESIKSRRRKRQNREGIVISGPQALDLSQLGQRSSVRKPDAVYSTPPSPSAVSPMHAFPKSPLFGNELKVPSHSENFLSPNRSSPKRTPTTPRSMRTSPLHFFTNQMPHLKEGKSDDSSSYYSDSQESSTADSKVFMRKTPLKTRRFLQRTGKVDDIGAHSDSECHHGRKLLIKDTNANSTEVKVKKLTRGGSLNLGKDGKKRDGFRTASFRSRSTNRKETKSEEIESCKKTPVMRWHSFQMEQRPLMVFRKCFSQKIQPKVEDEGSLFAAMSAGQLQIIRKLALVILTGYMERYCPTHRSGWNWELPKFIKKIKMPDYKDKKVFGVPLLLVLQRTGQTLPVAVRSAFRWLQLNALDQIGLFRKSGVKSRIIKLKELIEYSESTAECMEVFNTQQAYDVADMLKQYFRDLPESLLTTKMSETFATIFQHLPPDVRLDAVQCAVLLLPDENREILYALLEFLTLVAANSQFNQMTANNLAVCLAPSLFHSSISTSAVSVTASPRRRKGTGVPDAKELSEAKASHECLAFMIDNYKQIFTASKEKIAKCNFGYMEESKPVPLEALGEGMQFHNWRGYLYECTSATIKEGREKTRGWITIASQADCNVEIAYKKVGDGHPLRLWRCITEVEGPPKDVLNYIVNHRASWDSNLLQCQTVKKLDERTEIFQYAVDGQFPTDFCVLRSWQTDLPRGACVIVETSIDNAKAKVLFGAVRGVVLASRYLIEPCGSGRSRVMHLARVDIKGKTPEWYNKSYGYICSHHLAKIRLAFKHNADGPESKV